MHQHRLNKFIAKIAEIYNKDVLHSLTDLEEILQVHKDAFDSALGSCALFPYKFEAERMINNLGSLKMHILRSMNNSDYIYENNVIGLVDLKNSVASMPICEFQFKFYLMQKDFYSAFKIINKQIPKFENRAVLFNDLFVFLMRDIKLNILPNLCFENAQVYTNHGILIMPTTKESPSYHAFNISTTKCSSCDKEHVSLKQHTSQGFDSIDSALNLIGEPENGTIAIAEHTEHYPLIETSLPIVKDKYEKALLVHALN